MAWPAMCWPTRKTVNSKERAPHQLAAAGLRPLLQGREHRGDAEHAAQEVDHRGAGAQTPGSPVMYASPAMNWTTSSSAGRFAYGPDRKPLSAR